MSQRSQLGEYLKQQFLQGQGIVTQTPGQTYTNPHGHKGYDIAVPVGTPVNTKGLQYVGAQRDTTGYGTRAAFKDPTTGKAYIFSHLSKIQQGPEGVQVYTGGRSGIDGRSTGPHLDLEIADNFSGFNNMLRNVMARAQSSGPRAYAQQTQKRSAQDVFAKAKSVFGNKVVGVASNAKLLEGAQKKYGGRIVRL